MFDKNDDPYKNIIKQNSALQRKKEIKSKGHNSRNKEGAVKNDALKPRMSLIPQLALLEIGKVMTYGAEKYVTYNWMDGFDFTILTDAAQRHITAFLCGEDLDPESNLHHLAHASSCLMMLYELTQLNPERDDRWEGWSKEKNRLTLEKAQKPYNSSEYLLNALEKKNSSQKE